MSAETPPSETPRKNQARWIATAALVVGVLGGLGYYLWSRGKLPFVSKGGSDRPLAATRTVKRDSLASITQLAFYPDGKWLVGGEGAAKLVIWDVTTGQEIYHHEEKLSDGSKAHEERYRR